jgi:hypothetical protein
MPLPTKFSMQMLVPTPKDNFIANPNADVNAIAISNINSNVVANANAIANDCIFCLEQTNFAKWPNLH